MAMKATVLLDSVILIDHFNAVNAATDYIRSIKTEAVVSVVTRAEVLVGFSSKATRSRGVSLLNHFKCLPITLEDSNLAARLRRANKWTLPDAFQAALAKKHGLSLSTRNTRDFDPDTHSFITIPYHPEA